jgi:YidC/Oxa1 family membrane protein insertase
MKSDTFRTVIGFALIIAILVGWQILFRPKPKPAAAVQPAPAETAAPAETTRPEPQPEPATLAPAPAAADEAVLPETTVVIENDLIRIEVSSLGGAITSARLKRYDADLVPDGEALFGIGLITADGYVPPERLPMSLVADDSSVTATWSSGPLGVRRTVVLGAGYELAERVAVAGELGLVHDALSGIAITEANVKEALSHFHFYAQAGKKLRQVQAGKLKKPDAAAGQFEWAGLKSKYFLAAVATDSTPLDSTYAGALPDNRAGFVAVVRRAPAESHYRLFLAPLEYNLLRSYHRGFENVIGLGWTRPIALGMLWLLKLLYSVLRNWGLAIVVFSILMKALFYPLTRTQTKQLRQMQMLQPKLNELKAKYKDDAQKLNAETMQLYRLYKINPLSGCLPLVVQLPIFWALYAVLRNSIDLRGAHFVLWLRDLSQPDVLFGHIPAGLPFVGGAPIGLLPVLMGVSFIAQNLITSTDKRNWAMTVIFPVFITLIFLNMPSGLQLYWFMYNILSIVESLIGIKGGSLWKSKGRKATAPATTG